VPLMSKSLNRQNVRLGDHRIIHPLVEHGKRGDYSMA
jgi:hypothetical protein